MGPEGDERRGVLFWYDIGGLKAANGIDEVSCMMEYLNARMVSGKKCSMVGEFRTAEVNHKFLQMKLTVYDTFFNKRVIHDRARIIKVRVKMMESNLMVCTCL